MISTLTPAQQEANRYIISSRDCDDARDYLDAYFELKQKDAESGSGEFFKHREGLVMAAIISYSRPFKCSHSKGFAAKRVSIDRADVFANDQARAELHDRILDRRGQAVAHSEWAHRSSALLSARAAEGVLRKSSVVATTRRTSTSRCFETWQ